MASLFDIDERILKLVSLEESDVVNPETGEVLVDVMAELEQLDMQRTEKILAIGRYIDSLDREQTMLKEKAKQLTERAKSNENKSKFLKEFVLNSMTVFGDKKIEDDTVTIKLNITKVALATDENATPEAYTRTTVKVEPDRRKILADLKANKEVAGWTIGESKTITVR